MNVICLNIKDHTLCNYTPSYTFPILFLSLPSFKAGRIIRFSCCFFFFKSHTESHRITQKSGQRYFKLFYIYDVIVSIDKNQFILHRGMTKLFPSAKYFKTRFSKESLRAAPCQSKHTALAFQTLAHICATVHWKKLGCEAIGIFSRGWAHGQLLPQASIIFQWYSLFSIVTRTSFAAGYCMQTTVFISLWSHGS